MFKKTALSILSAACALYGAAHAECDYRFSGQIMVKHNGKLWPLKNAKVRVKRQNGTGAGRNFVRTDNNGRFQGVWRFDRDQNGKLPGNENIRFAVQLQLQDDDRVKIGEGGWFNTPWDTFAKEYGKNCQTFIMRQSVLNADALSPFDLPKRAYIYTVMQKLLHDLEARGVGLKNRIEVIYPDKHVYDAFNNGSWFLQKSHIDEPDWNNTVTLIHETMHQWDVNWLKGETSFACVADAHHKSPDKWNSARCSGFMEGFAQATAIALYRDRFASHPYFHQPHAPTTKPLRPDQLSRYYDGAIRKGEDAERTDKGWQNFLQYIMWNNEWDPFNPEANPDLYNFSTCQPTDAPIYKMLKALKDEAPNHGGSKARFTWFTDLLEKRIDGFDEWDAQFYHWLGDPATEPVAMQLQMCPDAVAAMKRLQAPLSPRSLDGIKKPSPGGVIKPSTLPKK